MPYDVGDTVPLSFTVKDLTGQPAAAGAVTVTVTLPDGTTASPAVLNPTLGSYTSSVVTTQSGHHRVNWVASAPNAAAYADVFEVLTADPRFLISLDAGRKALRKSAGDTIDDEELRDYIAAVTPVVEDLTGPLLAATRTYTTSGGGQSILLPALPSAVISVTESGALLTPNAQYTVNLSSGVVTRGTQYWPYVFLPGVNNVAIVYAVGGSAIQPNHRIAARIILKQMWDADQTGYRPGYNATAASDQSMMQTPAGFLVPKRAYELLRPTPGAPGFA